VLFSFVQPSAKITDMDNPDPKGTTELARAYLKQLCQPGSTPEIIQKPEMRAWLEVEKRLMLSESEKPKEAKRTLPSQPAMNAPKKVQSIWNRPISDLWR
jgi:hypothetical protein